MFGLGKFLYTIIFAINGVAVLSEDRFLNRIGWGNDKTGNSATQYQQFGAEGDGSIKTKLVTLITAVRTLMRVPLIAVNVVLILYELILG